MVWYYKSMLLGLYMRAKFRFVLYATTIMKWAKLLLLAPCKYPPIKICSDGYVMSSTILSQVPVNDSDHCSACCAASPCNTTYDYIIVGSGASGIPLADRLSESGKSVLLIERGFASSGRWGGHWKPSWLEGTNLTRFDVPALAQLVWTDGVDNAGIFCDDGSPSPAGCLLGGGPAINAGQFYMVRIHFVLRNRFLF